MSKFKIKWDSTIINGADATFKWNTAPNNPSYPRYTWDEVELIQHAAGEDYNLWEEDKKKRLVKLILKVQGNTITESKKREIKQYKIKAKDIKIVAGDYEKRSLDKKMNTPKLVGDIVTHWQLHGEDRPTVVFASSIPGSIPFRPHR